MEDLLSSLLKDEKFKRSLIKKRFAGLVCASKAAVAAALGVENKKILIVTNSSEDAFWLKQEILVFNDELPVSILQAPDPVPGETLESSETAGQRLSQLEEFITKEKSVLISPLRSMMYKTSRGEQIALAQNKEYKKISEKLVDFGYKRLPVVGERGEFSVRGGILDVFPSNSNEPFRIELYGDTIESIRIFDPVSQRSKAKINEITIFDTTERREKNLIQLLPQGCMIIFDEDAVLVSSADKFIKDMPEGRKGEISTYEEIKRFANERRLVHFSSFIEPSDDPMFSAPKSFVNSIDEISNITKNLMVISQHAARLSDLKASVGQIRCGFETDNWIVLSDSEVFGLGPQKPKVPSKVYEGVGDEIRADIEEGDYVVHEDYGVGIFRGLQKIEEGDFALIEFAEGDKLYVPPNLLGRIEKYVSEEGYKPKLSRMGGASWANLKKRVKKSLKDLTEELISLYAERKKTLKIPYPKDDIWQKELEDSFPYEETPDQLKAISEVKEDLESSLPMDRLLCGDVGYGKTEVALRAIVKASAASKQTAVLVPTTILAEQHYHYFKERLKAFPFKIASLSRFRSREEQKKIVDQLKLGEIDIVVGTHRLLSSDVGFSDLGLLVIDEEHRFGVAHKEKLKKLKKSVDVLSMTATPIPRTLYFSLSGARDLSLIQTPPADRSPVKTYVAQFNPALVKEAILRELDRGGQIFFVHNYIETIDNVAGFLKNLLPEIKIAVAHGRMQESHLEKVMDEFLNRRYDVLLCTAIIESGLDIPNVNTIFINYADKLGLAQLYQLRGRVGRSPVKAYAYLMYHQEEIQTQSALSRLRAIQEFTSLGSGYKLALRDLEIRGSGNLLGAEQHGHVLAVGFDLYCELLSEAVKEAKGLKEPTPRQVVIDIRENAYIPGEYIEDEQQRIALYRRLNLLSGEKELAEFKEELTDRFGKIPHQCAKLFEIVNLKIKALRAGIKSIRGDLTIYVDWQNGKGKKFKLATQNKIKEIISRIGL